VGVTEFGLPKSELASVIAMLEILCLNSDQEQKLPPRLNTVLHRAVNLTYEELIDSADN